MRYRPIDQEPEDPRLGRFIPDDWRHVEEYPLAALPLEQRPTQVPVVIGVNWYPEFDDPAQDGGNGEYFVARGGPGSLSKKPRGGHCVCLEPGGERADRDEWYAFYDQGSEGACVGFGWSRCMTILNQDPTYAARWLWDRGKECDEWPQTNPGDDEGTSVRAAGDVLAGRGHVCWQDAYADDDYTERATYTPEAAAGLQTFRWAQSVEEVHAALGNERGDELGAVQILNSWGTNYPHRVWLPDDVLGVLMEQEGEVAIPTDR